MRSLLLILVGALTPVLAMAEPTWLGVGAVLTPQYQGSDKFTVRPAPSFAFSLGSVRVTWNGPGVAADLISTRGIDAGPILRYNFGRNPDNIDNAAVKALPKIDGSVEAGAFAQIGYPIATGTFLTGRVEVIQGLGGGHGGLTAQGSVGLLRPGDTVTLGVAASATYADKDYMQSFFGVGAGSASGLGAFSPDGGVKDVGLRAFANYNLTDSWSLTGFAGLSQLVGPAADSPIVGTGSKTQSIIGVGVSYTFN